MDNVFTYFLYIITTILLILSFITNKKKTNLALKRALKMFLSVLPQFLAILFLVGLLLAAVSSEMIQSIIGTKSGIWGMVLASLVGSVTLIPVLIAFPIASKLLQNGAGLMQITVFISTLTTVGFVTMPLENKYLGTKVTLLRTMLCYIFSFVIALTMGVILT